MREGCALLIAEMVCINQWNTLDWGNVKPINAGIFHTVGLKEDGIVVAAGANDYGQYDVSEWNDIVTDSKLYSWTKSGRHCCGGRHEQ